jgi:hypothetical protein
MSDPFRPGNLIALYNLNNRKLLSSCPITCWSWSVIPERTFSLVKDYNIKLDANDIFRIHDLGSGTIGFEPLGFPGTLIFPFDGSSVTFSHFLHWTNPANATWRENIEKLKPIFSNVPLSQRSSVARFRAEKTSSGYYIRHVDTGLIMTIGFNKFPIKSGINNVYPHLTQECTSYCFNRTIKDTWVPIEIDRTKCCMGIDDLHSSQSVCAELWKNPAICDKHMIQFCTNNPDSSYCTCLTSPIKQYNPLCVDGECIKGGYVTQNMTRLPCPNVVDCSTQILLGQAGRDVSIGQNQIVQQCGGTTIPDNESPPQQNNPPPSNTPTPIIQNNADTSNDIFNSNKLLLIIIFLFVLVIALISTTVYYYYGKGEQIMSLF